MTLRILTSIIFFFTAFSFSFAQSGDLVIFSTEGTTFNVAIDGKFQNKKATHNLKITNLPEGDYSVSLLFSDKKKEVKSNLQVQVGHENTFVIAEEGSSLKLKAYSTVPLNQVVAVSSSQIRTNYNKVGVEIRSIDNAQNLAKSKTEQDPKYMRVHGSSNNIKEEVKHQEQDRQEGTTLTTRYIKTDNSDGSVSIVEEITTITKKVVERNGQPQMRTRRSVAMTPTDYICLPMEASKFDAIMARVHQLSSKDRLALVEKEIKDQCLTTEQIRTIGDVFDKDDLKSFALVAQPTAADPNTYPYENTDIAVVDTPLEEVKADETAHSITNKPAEETAEVIAATGVELEEKVVDHPTMTKAEIRAKLKATKIRAKAERKAAKAKAKAERKAAKAKAKAERKAAKAKAKAERIAAKAQSAKR